MNLPFINAVAIDPLFLVFPENIAIILAEKLHPHVPSVADIQKALHSLPQEQRAVVASRARVLGALAQVTEQAIQGMGAKAETAR